MGIDCGRKAAVETALKVDGWLSEGEADLLYGLAHNAQCDVVEVGSFMGRSTVALGLGAKHGGRGVLVHAVDNFAGIAEHNRNGGELEKAKPTAALLRANLDGAGVNGQVTIKDMDSRRASDLFDGQCSVLFVDGEHTYEALSKDLDCWLPKLADGGFVVLHDATSSYPGVLRAIDERLIGRPLEYRALERHDSAVVFQKVKTVRRTVQLMCPGSAFTWGTVCGIAQASLGAHRIDLDNNGNGWDDFQHLWAKVLNRAEAGEITHAAMLHSDCVPWPGWVDVLVSECEALGADMVSVACAMKDGRGLLNCGIGITSNRWGSWRRLTVRELQKLPLTFGLDDLKRLDYCGDQHDDKVLLHNTGCFVADLRREVFRRTAYGKLIASFDFPTEIARGDGGKWANRRESEDWHFSRQLHMLGAETYITRKVRLAHQGIKRYGNDGDWGDYTDGDEESAANWRKPKQEQ